LPTLFTNYLSLCPLPLPKALGPSPWIRKLKDAEDCDIILTIKVEEEEVKIAVFVQGKDERVANAEPKPLLSA